MLYTYPVQGIELIEYELGLHYCNARALFDLYEGETIEAILSHSLWLPA